MNQEDAQDPLPWTEEEIRHNVLAVVSLMILASILLVIQSWLFLPFYWLFWVLYFTVGRYFTCRHCDFLGKPCPSWCMGIIGGWLYKRTDKKDFLENGPWKALFFDVAFLALANIYPYLVYGWILFQSGLNWLDWILLAIYSVLGFLTLYVHSRGCRKCPVEACPLSKSDSRSLKNMKEVEI